MCIRKHTHTYVHTFLSHWPKYGPRCILMHDIKISYIHTHTHTHTHTHIHTQHIHDIVRPNPILMRPMDPLLSLFSCIHVLTHTHTHTRPNLACPICYTCLRPESTAVSGRMAGHCRVTAACTPRSSSPAADPPCSDPTTIGA